MQPHYLGRMDVVCDGCGVLHWDAARTTGQARSNNLFYSCCKKGKAILPLLQDPPEPLNSLINGSHPRSSHFLKHIKAIQYFVCFYFIRYHCYASRGPERRRGGVTPVSAHGELYHMQAPLNFGNAPKYNQLYIYDPEYAAACRSANPRNQHLDDSIIEALSEMIDDPVRCGNPFVRIYKHAHEILSAEEERQAQDHVSEDAYIRPNPQMRLELAVAEERRTQNLPTVNEISCQKLDFNRGFI